jgi:predicted kinase
MFNREEQAECHGAGRGENSGPDCSSPILRTAVIQIIDRFGGIVPERGRQCPANDRFTLMTLYLLCGLAFSGKSTLAAALHRRLGCALVSLDALNARRGLHGGLGIPAEEWARTHREALSEVEAALQAGRSVVVDDTNCFRFLRDNYREIAGRYGVPTVVIYLEIPLDFVRARMQANEIEPSRPPITEAVLLDLVAKFEPPAADERVVVFPAGASPEGWVADNLSPVARSAS